MTETTKQNGNSASFVEDFAENGAGEELVKSPRHREDPPAAYQNAAREVCDPEAIRVDAVELGKASQAIRPEQFKPLLTRIYHAIATVRAGAITGPAVRSAETPGQVSETTDVASAQILANALADQEKALRLRDQELPRAIAAERAAEEKEHEAAGKAEKAEAWLAEIRAAAGRSDQGALASAPETARRRSLFRRVSLSPRAAAAVAAADTVIGAIVLEPSVSDLVVTSVPYGTLLIATGLSMTLICASAAAGFALAALRLSGRSVGLLMLVVFGAILWKLVGGLDALRAGEQAGVETLTAASLAACYVAALTGYSMATRADTKDESDEDQRLGTTIGAALDARDRRTEEWEVAKAEKEAAVKMVSSLYGQIESLNDSAARGAARSMDRVGKGIEADVTLETIWQLAATGVGQELAAHDDWAAAMAELSYQKTRREELPDEEDSALNRFAEVKNGKQLPPLAKLAILLLGVGGVLGVVLGPIWPAIAATLAVFALLIQRAPVTTADPPRRVPAIDPAGPEESPLYIYQPDRMRPKYDSGGADHGWRQ